MKAYVFPGQGSQSKGMGEELFGKYKELIKNANEILRYDIQELCLQDPDNKLNITQYTQPALYTVNALMYYEYIKEHGEPDYVAGHSLGEYNALLAAKVYDYETGLRLVKYRAELMRQACDGGMAAVIGMEESKIQEVLKQEKLYSIDVANLNAPGQIVVSGPKLDIEKAKEVFIASGAMDYILLKVSGAFHSRYMQDASEKFEKFISTIPLNANQIPIIANYDARPYKVKDIKNNLVKQISNTVQWIDTIRYLMGKNVQDIVEIGPGRVLTGLTRKITRVSTPLIVEEKEELEEKSEKKLEEELEEEILPTEELEKSEDKEVKRLEGCDLGGAEFKNKYNLKYAYVTGGMYRGIASPEMVICMAKQGMLSFLGSGGLAVEQVERDITKIQECLTNEEVFGVDMIANINNPDLEMKLANVLIKKDVKCVEATAYISVSPALIWYKLSGLDTDEQGNIISNHRVIAKLSRAEVAETFMKSPSKLIVEQLLGDGLISQKQAEIAKRVTIADDICVESDSAGHTDHSLNFALFPSIKRLRDKLVIENRALETLNLGLAGGIGSPEAVASAFVLGADFVLTGSINQCTVEAHISNVVKDLLEKTNVQDMDYAPAGDMFELGGQVQVMKKGIFFPARARRLYDLYRIYDSIEKIDDKTINQIEKYYFKKSINDVYEEVKEYSTEKDIERMEKNPKYKMSAIFKWYFGHSSRAAISGNETCKVDFQIHCSPAMGYFNELVKGTELESWKNRHVDQIAKLLMKDAATHLNTYIDKVK